jgi:transcriptional regulator NrdR family protein
MSKSRNKARSTGPKGYSALRAVILCECGGETEIVNARGVAAGDTIRRERDCKLCCRRLTTYESLTAPASVERLDGITARLERIVVSLKGRSRTS